MIISVDEAQQQLEKAISLAQQGHEIIISGEAGSVALTRIPTTAEKKKGDWRSIFGVMKGEITYEEGWDAPLTDEQAKETFSSDKAQR